MKNRTIGIIGGAGPLAGILLTQKIINQCQKNYGCIHDEDYPQILLLSVPFAQMLKPNTPFQKESQVALQLKEALTFLIQSGADYLAIACNTLHSYLEIDEGGSRLIHLVEEAKKYIEEKALSRVLVLCTETSAKKNVYGFPSKLLPDRNEQVFIDQLIYKVLSGDYSYRERDELVSYVNRKVEKNPEIDSILLGCSELSVLMDQFSIELPGISVIDPLDILSLKLSDYINDVVPKN
jgi:aspartate/glutamate racemase